MIVAYRYRDTAPAADRLCEVIGAAYPNNPIEMKN